ncbi:MAG: hypothetical protein KDK51_03635 [Deltaproteobacteria bacterium]|nr:hypothetical protein [Deltaproteobacteria bacterium]
MKKLYLGVVYVFILVFSETTMAQQAGFDREVYLEKSAQLAAQLDCEYAHRNVSASVININNRKTFLDIILECAENRTDINIATDILQYAAYNSIKAQCEVLYPAGVNNGKQFANCFKALATGEKNYQELEDSWRIIPLTQEGSSIAVTNKTQHFFTWDEENASVDFADGYTAEDFATFVVGIYGLNSLSLESSFEYKNQFFQDEIRFWVWGSAAYKAEQEIPTLSLIEHVTPKMKTDSQAAKAMLPGLSLLKNIMIPTAKVLIEDKQMYPSNHFQQPIDKKGDYTLYVDPTLIEEDQECDRDCWGELFLKQQFINRETPSSGQYFKDIYAFYDNLVENRSVSAPFVVYPHYEYRTYALHPKKIK